MIRDILPTRTTIAITLTTPGKFTMTLTTVTFRNQNLLSRWGRDLQKGASLYLDRARSTLRNLRRKRSGSATKSSPLPPPAPGISPIVEYRQKVSTLRKIRKLSSKKLGKREEVRSGLRKARYTRHYSTAAKRKLTIHESGEDFWWKIKTTAHSEAMWEKRMASVYKDIFNLQGQERDLIDAVCVSSFFSVPPYYSFIPCRWREIGQTLRKNMTNLLISFFLAWEAWAACQRARRTYWELANTGLLGAVNLKKYFARTKFDRTWTRDMRNEPTKWTI